MTPPNVFVTGANRGVGRAVAELAAARGDTVLACAREVEAMPAFAGPGRVVPITLDVADERSISAAARVAAQHVQQLDLLINSAGQYSLQSSHWNAERTLLETMTQEELLTIFRVNTAGSMLVLRALLPLLRESAQARVVNLTSLLGSVSQKDSPGDYAYSGSKAALNIMTRAAAAELKDDGIIVVALTPGWVRTAMGGESAPLAPEEAATRLLRTADALRARDSGRLIDEHGEDLPW